MLENKSQTKKNNQEIVTLFQEIADAGGLAVSNPQEWQREIRQERPLPFREHDTRAIHELKL